MSKTTEREYSEIIRMVEKKRNALRKIVIQKGILATKEEKRCLDQYEEILLHLYEKYCSE